MPAPTRVYLRSSEHEFRPLFWIQNNAPNEMLLGTYPLSTSTPRLSALWPERNVATPDLMAMRYRWDERFDADEEVDHFTVHAGGRFHLKKIGGGVIYDHVMKRTDALGPETSVFLDVMIMSDAAEMYATRAQPKKPCIWFDVRPGEYLSGRANFSGVNFDLEDQMVSLMKKYTGDHGGVLVTSGTLKGLFFGRPASLDAAVTVQRPRGTILSFNFPVGDDLWHVKTFLLQ